MIIAHVFANACICPLLFSYTIRFPVVQKRFGNMVISMIILVIAIFPAYAGLILSGRRTTGKSFDVPRICGVDFSRGRTCPCGTLAACHAACVRAVSLPTPIRPFIPSSHRRQVVTVLRSRRPRSVAVTMPPCRRLLPRICVAFVCFARLASWASIGIV